MHLVAARSILVAMLLAPGACFRYVQEVRPLTADDCPPEPRTRASSRAIDTTNPAGIQGRVSRTGTLQPLPRASVRLQRLRDGVALRDLRGAKPTATDTSGFFRFDSLASGGYVVLVHSIGYRVSEDTVTVDKTVGAQIQFALETMPLDG